MSPLSQRNLVLLFCICFNGLKKYVYTKKKKKKKLENNQGVLVEDDFLQVAELAAIIQQLLEANLITFDEIPQGARPKVNLIAPEGGPNLDAINNAVTTLVSEISVLRNTIDGVYDQVDILKHQYHKLEGRLTVMEENREGPIKSDHPTQPTPHASTGVRKDPLKNDRPDNKTGSVSKPQAEKV